MCTLTIYSGKKRCVVTMNRDERRSRKEAGVLHSRTQNGVRLFYPVDLVSGGTWFGVNSHGVTLCLLNRYQAPQKDKAVSRGDIIPAALARGKAEFVSAWLQQLDHARYNPFDIFLVTRKQVIQYSWGGVTYASRTLDFKHWFLFASSGMHTEEVIAFRQNFFQAWHEEIGKKLTDPDEILRGFHLIQIDGMESHSPLMEREFSHTKSIIQADFNARAMQLKYLPNVLDHFPVSPLGEMQKENITISKG